MILLYAAVLEPVGLRILVIAFRTTRVNGVKRRFVSAYPPRIHRCAAATEFVRMLTPAPVMRTIRTASVRQPPVTMFLLLTLRFATAWAPATVTIPVHVQKTIQVLSARQPPAMA